MQFHIDRFSCSLPNAEAFEMTEEDIRGLDPEDNPYLDDDGDPMPGWYAWTCFPGCMPDSSPSGPYGSAAEAIEGFRRDHDDADLMGSSGPLLTMLSISDGLKLAEAAIEWHLDPQSGSAPAVRATLSDGSRLAYAAGEVEIEYDADTVETERYTMEIDDLVGNAYDPSGSADYLINLALMLTARWDEIEDNDRAMILVEAAYWYAVHHSGGQTDPMYAVCCFLGNGSNFRDKPNDVACLYAEILAAARQR